MQQAIRQGSKAAQQQLRLQQLELQWRRVEALLRRRERLQPRQPGREVAALRMLRQLLGRPQEQWLPSKEARQRRQQPQQG